MDWLAENGGAIILIAFFALLMWMQVRGVHAARHRHGQGPAAERSPGPPPPGASGASGASASKPAPSPARLALPAALLSFMAPGVGHLLIRAWSRGALWLAGWLVLGAVSGVAHSPVVLLLMAIAAVDAFVFARSQPPA